MHKKSKRLTCSIVMKKYEHISMTNFHLYYEETVGPKLTVARDILSAATSCYRPIVCVDMLEVTTRLVETMLSEASERHYN